MLLQRDRENESNFILLVETSDDDATKANFGHLKLRLSLINDASR